MSRESTVERKYLRKFPELADQGTTEVNPGQT